MITVRKPQLARLTSVVAVVVVVAVALAAGLFLLVADEALTPSAGPEAVVEAGGVLGRRTPKKWSTQPSGPYLPVRYRIGCQGKGRAG